MGRRTRGQRYLWRDRQRGMGKTIRNTANVGWFSADRTIRGICPRHLVRCSALQYDAACREKPEGGYRRAAETERGRGPVGARTAILSGRLGPYKSRGRLGGAGGRAGRESGSGRLRRWRGTALGDLARHGRFFEDRSIRRRPHAPALRGEVQTATGVTLRSTPIPSDRCSVPWTTIRAGGDSSSPFRQARRPSNRARGRAAAFNSPSGRPTHRGFRWLATSTVGMAAAMSDGRPLTPASGKFSSRNSDPVRSTNLRSWSVRAKRLVPLKADPFAFTAERRPKTASVVAERPDVRVVRQRLLAPAGDDQRRRAADDHL